LSAPCFRGIFPADEETFCDETLVGEIRSAPEYAKIRKAFFRSRDGGSVDLDPAREGDGGLVTSSWVAGVTGQCTGSAFMELRIQPGLRARSITWANLSVLLAPRPLAAPPGGVPPGPATAAPSAGRGDKLFIN
jgi:hypothetical protein